MAVWDGMEIVHTVERTNYPFDFSVADSGEAFGLTAQVTQPAQASRICGYMHTALEHLVQALENAPETPLRDLPILPAAERTLLLEQWNDTATSYPESQTIVHLFESQAAQAPDAIALVFEGTQLTYAELNAKANRLAHYLRDAGVGPDVRVALCAERSLDMIVAIFGILKAGGAYVPLDPACPGERFAFILEDAAPAILLIQQHLQAALPASAPLLSGIPLLCLDSQWELVQACPAANLPLAVRPDNLAYISRISTARLPATGNCAPASMPRMCSMPRCPN
jgi:non-ribosomal peptide synthetase component F